MGISKLSIAQTAAIQIQADVESAPAPRPVTVGDQAGPTHAVMQQARQTQRPATGQAEKQQEKAPAIQKKVGEKSAPPAKKYYTALDLKTAAGTSSDVLKLNDYISNIAKQSFQYQSDIDEIKKEIDNDGSDQAKLERDTVELNSLKAQLSQADTERTRKLNEIRAKYAEGTYKVNSRDIVAGWD